MTRHETDDDQTRIDTKAWRFPFLWRGPWNFCLIYQVSGKMNNFSCKGWVTQPLQSQLLKANNPFFALKHGIVEPHCANAVLDT